MLKFSFNVIFLTFNDILPAGKTCSHYSKFFLIFKSCCKADRLDHTAIYHSSEHSIRLYLLHIYFLLVLFNVVQIFYAFNICMVSQYLVRLLEQTCWKTMLKYISTTCHLKPWIGKQKIKWDNSNVISMTFDCNLQTGRVLKYLQTLTANRSVQRLSTILSLKFNCPISFLPPFLLWLCPLNMVDFFNETQSHIPLTFK